MILEFFAVLKTCFDFGITALTAFNWNASGVNGGSCRYTRVKGVLLESWRR